MQKLALLGIVLFVIVACTQETLQGAITKEIVQTERPPVSVREVEPPKEGMFVLFIKTEPFGKDTKNAVGKLTVLEVSAFHKELGFWTKISSTDVLLSTTDKMVLPPYATASIRAGRYEQLRVKISDVIIEQEGKEILPKLLTQEIKIPSPFEIRSDEETRMTVRVLFGNSLYKQGEIFAPVVEVVSGAQKQEFFMNAKGVMGKEKFDIVAFEVKETAPTSQEKKQEETAAQEESRAALDAAVMKISPGEKKKFVVNKK